MKYVLLISIFYLCFTSTLSKEEYRPENGSFQYQSSFTAPFGGTHIPFWEIGGSSIVMDTHLRLTPNQPSQRGFIWSNRLLRARDWEIVLKFSVGSEKKVGADGMAFWYTKERAQTGNIMGNSDTWNGLGIIIDTFDNDGQHDGPQIYAVHNDRSFAYDLGNDGDNSRKLGSCSAPVRQISAAPKFIKLLIRLKDKTLHVAYDNSEVTGLDTDWQTCFTVPAPIEDTTTGYYLGVTAETGGLDDFHDVKSLTTWSLRSTKFNPRDKDDIKELEKMKGKTTDTAADPPVKDNKNIKDKDKKYEGDPSADILTRLTSLEKKDVTFSDSLDVKFAEMQVKLEAIEKKQTDSLTRISKTVESIQSGVDGNQLDEMRQNVKSALQSIISIKDRIEIIEDQVIGTNRKTADLHGLQNVRSDELREIVERGSSWGFWTYFMILQIIICGAYIYFKNREEKTKYKSSPF